MKIYNNHAITEIISDSFDGKAFAETLTTRCGVYRMLDNAGKTIYVGKARNLRKRVSNYFASKSRIGPKVRAMLGQVCAIEVTVTHTENEALILESNLIKELNPRYNIVLRDDKSYPYIYLSSDQEFPRLAFHRGARAGAGQYFGPFPSASSVRASINLLQKLFLIRPCEDSYFRNRTRPCLQYQIKRCSAPCVGLVSTAAYREDVEHAILFLQGKSERVIDILIERMEAVSSALAFERAARIRDQINQLKLVQQRQCITGGTDDIDFVAGATRDGCACVQVLEVRSGHILGHKAYHLTYRGDAGPVDILAAFLPQYYLTDRADRTIPPEIVVNENLPEAELMTSALSQFAGKKVTIRHRVRGERARCIAMAVQNTEFALVQRIANQARWLERLAALQQALLLEAPIGRLECFDVSHMRGEAPLASCVVFDAEGPVKTGYRRFSILGITPGDDYGALAQALQRHYLRGLREARPLPDVLLLDGGEGQLSRARETFESLDIKVPVIVAVAKGPSRRPGLETLIIGAKRRVLDLPMDSLALHLIQQIRDEAHRFAIAGHRLQRAKARNVSPLEVVAGVGPKRRRDLMQHFGGFQGVERAGIDDLSTVKGISKQLAAKIYHHLHETA
ncbi:MAG: excinuclease ABC subunit UvrC [Gammaproteobacteria bacterium]